MRSIILSTSSGRELTCFAAVVVVAAGVIVAGFTCTASVVVFCAGVAVVVTGFVVLAWVAGVVEAVGLA